MLLVISRCPPGGTIRSHVPAWVVLALALLSSLVAGPLLAAEPLTTLRVELDRGVDRGQNFGSLFEVATSDGELVLGAGFANQYNTRLRGDRTGEQRLARTRRADQQRSARRDGTQTLEGFRVREERDDLPEILDRFLTPGDTGEPS